MSIIRSKDVWPQIKSLLGIDDSRAIKSIVIRITNENSMVELSIEEYAATSETRKERFDQTTPQE